MKNVKLLVWGVLVVFMTVSGVSLCMAAGNLVIYNAGSPEMGEDLIRAFNGKYPDIKVEIIRAGSGELLTRIKAEANRPQGDIIMAIAKENNVCVVEDACQVPGATVQGRRAGTWGDAGVLSFGGSKLLTAGRGGAMITNDARVLQRAKIFVERGNDAFPLASLLAQDSAVSCGEGHDGAGRSEH